MRALKLSTVRKANEQGNEQLSERSLEVSRRASNSGSEVEGKFATRVPSLTLFIVAD